MARLFPCSPGKHLLGEKQRMKKRTNGNAGQSRIIFAHKILWHLRPGEERPNGSRVEGEKIRVGDWKYGLKEKPAPRLCPYHFSPCLPNSDVLYHFVSVKVVFLLPEFQLARCLITFHGKKFAGPV